MTTPKPKRKCSIEGCDQSSRARGMCKPHYRRAVRNERRPIESIRRFDDINEAFQVKTKEIDGCLVWTGQKSPDGHGLVSRHGMTRHAHKVRYEMEVGPVPDGMVLDHTCRNPPCVKVSHLRVVTQKQNMENRSGPNRNNGTSKYLGVTFCKQTRKWVAKMKHNGQRYWGGRHDTEEAAAEAVRQLRLKFYTHNDLDRQGPLPGAAA